MSETETYETIRYTADVVGMTPDGLVLLIERGWDPYEGMWALPGGHVDPGETSLAAAVRELKEETGIDVAPEDLRQIGVWDTPGRDPRGRYVTVAYLAVDGRSSSPTSSTRCARSTSPRPGRTPARSSGPHPTGSRHCELPVTPTGG